MDDGFVGHLGPEPGEPPERTARTAGGINHEFGAYLFPALEDDAAHGAVLCERVTDHGLAASNPDMPAPMTTAWLAVRALTSRPLGFRASKSSMLSSPHRRSCGMTAVVPRAHNQIHRPPDTWP